MKSLKIIIISLIFILINFKTVKAWGGKPVEYRSLEFKGERTVENGGMIEKSAEYNHGTGFLREIKLKNNMAESNIFIEGQIMRMHFLTNGELRSINISDNQFLNQEGMLLFETDKETLILSKPVATNLVKKGLRDLESSKTRISFFKSGTGYNINIKTEVKSLKENLSINYWGVSSKEALFLRGYGYFKKIAEIMNSKDYFIAPEGYFYRMPESYEPYSENRYYLNPSSYIILSLIGERNEFYEILFASLLRLVEKEINNQGFVPLYFTSSWLDKDYNISENYYDTRWNMDLCYYYLIAYERYRFPQDLKCAERMLDYFITHSSANSFKVSDGVITGIFVADYFGGNSKITHSSLNHQLMEIKVLYKAFQITGDEKYLFLGDNMMNAIEITADNWIKEDKDLHYAIYPDYTYGLSDYPDLTYNDLSDVSILYRNIHKEGNIYLKKLMQSKEEWIASGGKTEKQALNFKEPQCKKGGKIVRRVD